MSRRHQLMRSPLPRATQMVACCAAVLALVGCGAGQVTQTDSQVGAVDGSSADIGNIAIRDALLPYPTDHHGEHPAGSTVPIQLTLVNQGSDADTLVAARTPAARQVLLLGTTTIPAGRSVAALGMFEHGSSTAPPAAPTETTSPAAASTTTPVSQLGIGELRLVLVDTTRTVRPGQNIDITLVFRNAGTITLPVPMGPPPEESERKPLDGSGHS